MPMRRLTLALVAAALIGGASMTQSAVVSNATVGVLTDTSSWQSGGTTFDTATSHFTNEAARITLSTTTDSYVVTVPGVGTCHADIVVDGQPPGIDIGCQAQGVRVKVNQPVISYVPDAIHHTATFTATWAAAYDELFVSNTKVAFSWYAKRADTGDHAFDESQANNNIPWVYDAGTHIWQDNCPVTYVVVGTITTTPDMWSDTNTMSTNTGTC